MIMLRKRRRLVFIPSSEHRFCYILSERIRLMAILLDGFLLHTKLCHTSIVVSYVTVTLLFYKRNNEPVLYNHDYYVYNLNNRYSPVTYCIHV